VILREEPRPRVFENGVLWRILSPRRDEVADGWRKLHNEDLHNLSSSPSTVTMIKSSKMRWVRHVALMWAKRNAYNILAGKRERKDTNRKTKT
jgi:hypothetical protein